MLDGRRKSTEPMAARLGEVHYQALHHFVAVSPWDWRPVRRRLVERLVAALEPTAWAVDDTGFPKDGEHSVGCSASTAARWARPPTASWGCRSTPSPGRPAARWTGGCFSRLLGRATPGGGRPVICRRGYGTGPSGSWCWTCWMSWRGGGFHRRCWSPTPATRVGEFRQGLDDREIGYVVQVKADTSAYPNRPVRRSRRIAGGVGARGRATATSRPRSSSSPWRQGHR